MKKEIEYKFDVPLYENERDILPAVEAIILSNGYIIQNRKKISRRFTYYDNQKLDIYKSGGTIRLVEGFDPKLNKGIYRGDIKIGLLDNRFEREFWSSDRAEVNSALMSYKEEIGIKGILKPVAVAATLHYKFDIVRDSTGIEAVLDNFAILGAESFREFEIELKKGNESILKDLSKIIENSFGWRRLHQQKYSRIIEMIFEHDAMKQPGRDTMGKEDVKP